MLLSFIMLETYMITHSIFDKFREAKNDLEVGIQLFLPSKDQGQRQIAEFVCIWRPKEKLSTSLVTAFASKRTLFYYY